MTGWLPSAVPKGLAVPSAIDLSAQTVIDVARRAAAIGVSPLLMTDTNGHDALVMAGAVADRCRGTAIGTAVVPLGSRSETALAMAAATIAEMTDAPVILGVGTSSPAIVEGWHRSSHDPSLAKTRERVTRIVELLRGSRIGSFSLARTPRRGQVKVLVAALGPRMLDLAYEHGDGAVINHTPAEAVAPPPSGKELIALQWVLPNPEAEAAARRQLVGYATTPAYRDHFVRMGFAADVEVILDLRARRRLKDAPELISREFVRAIYSPLEELGERQEAWKKRHVTPVAIPVLGEDPLKDVDKILASLESELNPGGS